ncbi:hypothetical protein JCM19236_5534 [Vibrio sp. JCM 19236]|nr:hypothetical protein JCM19236_5534 [Vibrio sp. JCM 19236]
MFRHQFCTANAPPLGVYIDIDNSSKLSAISYQLSAIKL